MSPDGPEEEAVAALALAGLPGLGGHRCLRLVERFGSATAALAATAAQWAGVIGPAMAAAARAAAPEWSEARRQHAAMAGLGGRVVPLAAAGYPALLRRIAAPPPALFALGDGSLAGPCVAIVGTRNASPYGLAVARRLGRELASRGVCVVSGMARGIDAAAHLGALEGRGVTLAVLGCGPDVVYPRQNLDLHRRIQKQGAILSERPPGSPPDAGSFPRRNRIISGVSLGVVVVEAPAHSGALITASCALEQGREVFAVPGEVVGGRSAGCHRLLKEGARLVEGVADVVEELAGVLPQLCVEPEPTGAPPHTLRLSSDERRVLTGLAGGPRDVDRLAEDLELPPSRLLGTLLELELAGLVAQLPGRRFTRVGA